MTAAETTALPKKAGLVDLDRTRERLTKLGLVHAAETLATHVGVAVKETHAPHRFLDDLLEAELVARDERRVRTSLRLSGLPDRRQLFLPVDDNYSCRSSGSPITRFRG